MLEAQLEQRMGHRLRPSSSSPTKGPVPSSCWWKGTDGEPQDKKGCSKKHAPPTVRKRRCRHPPPFHREVLPSVRSIPSRPNLVSCIFPLETSARWPSSTVFSAIAGPDAVGPSQPLPHLFPFLVPNEPDSDPVRTRNSLQSIGDGKGRKPCNWDVGRTYAPPMRVQLSQAWTNRPKMANGMRRRTKGRARKTQASKREGNGSPEESNGEGERTKKPKLVERAPEGASTDIKLVLGRFWRIAAPYWTDPEVRGEALMRAGLLIGITVATTGISVWFNFLGRDFYNALAEKDVSRFWTQLSVYLGAFVVGIPVFVFRDYFQSILALKWREWTTDKYLEKYFANRKYYDIQSKQLVDNPDQRINDDIRVFTDTALGFFLTIFNSILDLISFSAIMFSIYPPLFLALLVYALGGTAISLWLGRNLVVLNFMQEQREADFRYSLVRIRENAESIAFYKGEKNEKKILFDRFSSVLDNFQELVTTSRNLNFFTSFYRLLIQLVPLAVVAPQYFKGAIELGVVNQSSSAFNHILSDVSLVVYQIETIAGLSAVVDRLGEFVDVLESTPDELSGDGTRRIKFSAPEVPVGEETLLQVKKLTLKTPDYLQTLFCKLDFSIAVGESLLIMGPSGSGKTSLLRVLAGLWDSGDGEVCNFAFSHAACTASSYTGTFFLPQRPYMVLGTLREQLLYPTWITEDEDEVSKPSTNFPADEYLVEAMHRVQLGYLLDRLGGLDERADWSAMLSLGEQQRLAFARLLLARPSLALMDECTSAMDEENEMQLYNVLAHSGITYISIGHRSSLKKYHKRLLRFSAEKSQGTGAPWGMEDVPEAKNEQVHP